MKLVCTVTVGNRLLPTLPVRGKKKAVKSTIALCKHPNSDKYYLILFSGQDKNGVKYDLKQNIEKVLTKFVNEGKTTIQFKNPPHDLFIQADSIPLKGFLHLLQRILKGTVTAKEMSHSSLGVTPVATKDIAPTKLVIQNRSEYPIRGFPRTLESLTITKINRSGLDMGILRLGKLKILNLSENCITSLPVEFSKMLNLHSLDISSNQFHKSLKRDWKWLDGNLCKTLQSLNLANNQLVVLPERLIKFQNLKMLNLNNNLIEVLPNGIGRLSLLMELRLAHNKIRELPGTIQNLKLKLLDISDNRFRDSVQDLANSQSLTVLPICTLKEYAAQRVLSLRLLYNSETIPATLVTFLDEQAKYCICGKPCFSNYVHKNSSFKLMSLAEHITRDDSTPTHVPISIYFCSSRCANALYRNRAPFVR